MELRRIRTRSVVLPFVIAAFIAVPGAFALADADDGASAPSEPMTAAEAAVQQMIDQGGASAEAVADGLITLDEAEHYLPPDAVDALRAARADSSEAKAVLEQMRAADEAEVE